MGRSKASGKSKTEARNKAFSVGTPFGMTILVNQGNDNAELMHGPPEGSPSAMRKVSFCISDLKAGYNTGLSESEAFTLLCGFLPSLPHVKTRISAGVSLETPGLSCGLTPLEYAARKGHNDIAKALLDAKADPLHGAPILWACYTNHLSMTELLLQQGCDVAALEVVTCSNALHYAAENGSADCVRWLFGQEIPWVRDSNGRTPLDAAKQLDGNSEVVKLFGEELRKGKRVEKARPSKCLIRGELSGVCQILRQMRQMKESRGVVVTNPSLYLCLAIAHNSPLKWSQRGWRLKNGSCVPCVAEWLEIQRALYPNPGFGHAANVCILLCRGIESEASRQADIASGIDPNEKKHVQWHRAFGWAQAPQLNLSFNTPSTSVSKETPIDVTCKHCKNNASYKTVLGCATCINDAAARFAAALAGRYFTSVSELPGSSRYGVAYGIGCEDTSYEALHQTGGIYERYKNYSLDEIQFILSLLYELNASDCAPWALALDQNVFWAAMRHSQLWGRDPHPHWADRIQSSDWQPFLMELQRQGNAAFVQGCYDAATEWYNAHLYCALKPSDRFKILSNRALCFQRLGRPAEALADALASASANPKWIKAYFHQSVALEALGRLEEAREALQRGLAIEQNADLATALQHLELK